MAKKENSEIEVKIRVPKALMAKINDFRHSKKLDSKKEAIVYALDAFFSQEMPSGGEPRGNGADKSVGAPFATDVEHPEAAVVEPVASTGSAAEATAVEPSTHGDSSAEAAAEDDAPRKGKGSRSWSRPATTPAAQMGDAQPEASQPH